MNEKLYILGEVFIKEKVEEYSEVRRLATGELVLWFYSKASGLETRLGVYLYVKGRFFNFEREGR